MHGVGHRVLRPQVPRHAVEPYGHHGPARLVRRRLLQIGKL